MNTPDLARILKKAVRHHQKGEMRRAETLYKKILHYQPDHPEALHLSGVIANQSGQYERSEKLLLQAIAGQPNNAIYHYNLGNTLKAQNKYEESLQAYQQAVALKTDFTLAYNNLGNVLHELSRPEAAIPCYQQAIRYDPGYAEAYNNLGNSLKDIGKLEAALASFQKAFSLRPDNAEILINIGNILQSQNRHQEALDCLQKALILSPRSAMAHYNLATTLDELGQTGRAIAYFRAALQLDPNFAAAHCNLARALKDSGDYEGALRHYRQALALQPESAEAHNNLLFLLSYHVLCSHQEMLAAHQAWDQAHGGGPQTAQTFHHDRNDDPERRLRIGYVSPDLKHHAVSFFFEPLLAAHDRRQVEIFCYAEVNQPDAVTRRLEAQADHWCTTIGMSDEALARRIFADRIDVLIDLAGHTAGNRLKAFCYKPAPVQASYLGYCTTTGLATMDYWITDTTLYPEDSPELTTETPWRLDRCWLCYQPAADAPPVVIPQNDPLTFGSLNELSKLTPPVIDTWAEILRALPHSRLLLKTRVLADPTMQQQITARFAAQGIAPERLLLLPRSANYLGTYQSIDIALDPFPRTGGATTADALWMGVPVVTLAGERCIERQGASMLCAVGLQELIATSRADYVARACALAQNYERRRALRSSLRQRMADSPLCNATGLALALEHAYRSMWRQFLEQPT